MKTIGWAVKQLHNGARVRRTGWNGKGMYLFLINEQCWFGESLPAECDLKRLPFVVMKTATNELVPWLCSQTDLLAVDWESADPEPALHNE